MPAFVDENIKDAVPKFIRDTTDLIYKIEKLKPPDNCRLVTLDVVSLYTNNPNHEDLKAVARSLIRSPLNHTDPRTVPEHLKEVLYKNNFELAPSCANILVYLWEILKNDR